MNNNSIYCFFTIRKYSYDCGHFMTLILCHIPLFYSMTKYLIKIKHPVVYFFSSESTLKFQRYQLKYS